jgi:hypothetical protein
MALDWGRLTPAMRRALRDPVNSQPLRFRDIPGQRRDGQDLYEVNEREFMDRDQARALRRSERVGLTSRPKRATIEGTRNLPEDDDA